MLMSGVAALSGVRVPCGACAEELGVLGVTAARAERELPGV